MEAKPTAVRRLRDRQELRLAAALWRADRPMAAGWWLLLTLRGLLTFAYPATPSRPVLRGLNLTIPAGSSLAIVGQNGAGKTTLAKLLCRLYDPTSGVIEVDGVDLTELDLASWRRRVTAVFQDFARFELTLRENVAPRGAPQACGDDAVVAALEQAGARGLADRRLISPPRPASPKASTSSA